jgi:hypothetical protein
MPDYHPGYKADKYLPQVLFSFDGQEDTSQQKNQQV